MLVCEVNGAEAAAAAGCCRCRASAIAAEMVARNASHSRGQGGSSVAVAWGGHISGGGRRGEARRGSASRRAAVRCCAGCCWLWLAGADQACGEG